MATPYLNPKSRVFYIRVAVPPDVRFAFAGAALYQKSLGTKVLDEAVLPFSREMVAFKERVAKARQALAEAETQSVIEDERARELVREFLDAPEGTMTRGRFLLGRVEADAFMMSLTPPGAVSMERFQTGDILKACISKGWTEWRQLLKPEIKALARHHALPADLPAASLDALEGAFAAHLPTYRLPGSLARNERAERLGHGRRRRDGTSSRLRPDMQLSELFNDWKQARQPRPQTEHEFKLYVDDFVALIGDIPASQITGDDLLDYRDEAACLPAAMSREDRGLPFPERAAKFAGKPVVRISPASVKKRIGAIQALLGFGFAQRWLPADLGKGVIVEGYSKDSGDRRPFLEDELTQLFRHKVFMAPVGWKFDGAVSDSTVFWLFLLGATVGARIEEAGQAHLADCGQDAGIGFIDVTDYVAKADNAATAKSVKTAGSRRLIPVHDKLVEIGFDRYLAALRKAGANRLFPDLTANQFAKLTQEASRRANRIIDAAVGTDARIVFHSLRHTFKSLGRDANVPDSILDQICGHAPVSIGGKYGRGARLRTLHSHLLRIDLSTIGWEDLIKVMANVDWDEVVAKLMRPSLLE